MNYIIEELICNCFLFFFNLMLLIYLKLGSFCANHLLFSSNQPRKIVPFKEHFAMFKPHIP
jgi:hypothetical protein